MRDIWALALGSLWVAIAATMGSCSRPETAAVNRVRTVEEAKQALTLGPEDRREIRRIMFELASAHGAVSRPGPAAAGRRWGDVPLAVYYACEDAELAVISEQYTSTSYVCTLKSVEDYPGSLSIQRGAGDQTYEAVATIGRFGDHADRARRLLESFEQYLKQLAAKRGFDER